MKNQKEFLSFLDKSPVNFFAIKNAEEILLQAGYKEIKENQKVSLKDGDKVYFKRVDLTLIALNIGKEVKGENLSYNIIASHVDSPCYKLKPVFENKSDEYRKINVEPYGGMIISSWLDRPLSIAGRLSYIDKEKHIQNVLINIDKDLLMMTNLCIHFNRDINNGYNYNQQVDAQPFYGCDIDEEQIMSLLAKEANLNVDDILGHDLYVYNHEKAIVWGLNKEFVSSPRLDDLACVYTSLMAFVDSENPHKVNVLYLANNEEVGSMSSTGADSDFFMTTLEKVSRALKGELNESLASSFLISADNAHALHPNHPEVYDATNKAYMNKGLVIKFNGQNRYTTDGESAALLIAMMKKHKLPYQFFANRSDIRGGSTLGDILLTHLSLRSVDVGLAQLAMHSSYETMGLKDIENALKVFQIFYKEGI